MSALPLHYFPAGYFAPSYFGGSVSAAASSGGAGAPGSLLPSYFPSGYFPGSYFGASGSLTPSAFTLSVSVNYLPDPATSALQIVETDKAYGPYADSVTGPDDGGNYTLTIGLSALPPGLAPGPILVQPGDIVLGVFTANGPAIPGTLVSGSTSGTSLAWDVSLSGPVVSISSGSNFLPSTAAERVYCLCTALDTGTGAVVTLTDNADVLAVSLAIVQEYPVTADWQAATLITRDTGTAGDGEYLSLKVGPGQPLVLAPDAYYVFGQIVTTGGVIVVQAQGILLVTG